jgi:DNA-binding beta-propeller fold protein YncE
MSRSAVVVGTSPDVVAANPLTGAVYVATVGAAAVSVISG